MKSDNPKWANIHFPEIDFQDACYYAAPKMMQINLKV